MEGLQVPVERSVVFFTRFIEQRLVCFCRLSVAEHSAKAEHDQRTVNLHRISPPNAMSKLGMSVASIHQGEESSRQRYGMGSALAVSLKTELSVTTT
jgi:hypothetical protein